MSRGLLGPIVLVVGTANNMTGTTVITSHVMDFRLLRAGSIQCIWTGTPNGAFSLQGSLDYQLDPGGNVLKAGTWDDLGVTLGAAAGSAGSDLLDIAVTGIPWLRIQYTNTSSTGTLTIYGHGKGE